MQAGCSFGHADEEFPDEADDALVEQGLMPPDELEPSQMGTQV